MDIADGGAAHQEWLNAHSLANRPEHLDGPAKCIKCTEANDRRQQGFATCSDCVEGAI